MLLFSCSVTWGQGFTETYPSIHQGGAMDLVQTADEGYLLAGFSSNNSTLEDLYHATFVKTDADGSLQWEKAWVAPRFSVFNDVLIASDGNYVGAGSIGYALNFDDTPGITPTDAPYYGQGFLVKSDQQGNTLWQVEYGEIDREETFNSVIETTDGGYMLAGESHIVSENSSQFPYGNSNSNFLVDSRLLVVKYDQGGSFLWSSTLDVGEVISVHSIHPSNDGGAFIWVSGVDDAYIDLGLIKISAGGLMEWFQTYHSDIASGQFNGVTLGWKQVALENGNFVVAGSSFPSIANGGAFLAEVDTLGNVIWDKYYEDLDAAAVYGLTALSDGGFVMTGRTNTFLTTDYPLFWLKTNSAGEEEYRHRFEESFYDCGTSVIEIASGGLAISAISSQTGATSISPTEMRLITIFPNGSFYENELNGTVFLDLNESCTEEEDELGLENWLVIATGSDESPHYGTTDTLGNYHIELNAGTYEVTAIRPNELYTSCMDLESQNIVVGGADDPASLADFPHHAIAYCPLLSVDLSTLGLRRCWNNSYYLTYYNNGTATATDAYIEVALDEYLDIFATSVPYTNQGDTLLIFEVGDVPPGAGSTIHMNVYLDCDNTTLGQVHCSEAHIYPDSTCFELDPLWDLSSISTNGACLNDSIQFSISNDGVGNMSEALKYFIVVDEVIMLQGDFQLDSEESLAISIAADLQFYRLEAEQATGHPGMGMPSAQVLSCSDIINSNLFNWFGQNDQNHFIDIDCVANTGSFDPNEKRAFPIGYGDDHHIEVDTRLEYQINFQNTGTDTAFLVTLRDTLTKHLDISTLEFGASSHSYRWEVSPNGTLKFIFENILLPDSTTNEAASHGFVKYKISPVATTALGTTIENSAAIYFDFNAPVITNMVIHTIGKDFIPIEIITNAPDIGEQVVNMKAFPNPSNDGVNFELPFTPSKETYFLLYDNLGQQRRQELVNDKDFLFERNTLGAGIYYFSIENNGEQLFTGKVILN